MKRIFLFLFLILVGFAQDARAAWQEELPNAKNYFEDMNSYVGKKITKVVFVDEKNTPQHVRQKALLALDQEFHPELLHEILQWLFENQLQTRLEIYLEPFGNNALTMYVNYRQKVKIAKVLFHGNVAVSSNLLSTQIELKEGMDYEPSRVEEAVQRLTHFYNQQGYLNFEVKPQLKENGDLVFNLTEGAPTLIDAITISPLKIVEDKKLRARFEEELMEEFILHPGDRIDRDRVQLGLQNIKGWLRDHDFLTTKDPKIEYSLTDQNHVRISVVINYGSRIRFGFRGNTQFSYRELIDVVGEVKEVTGSSDYLDSVRRKIVESYKDIGFVNITINTLVREDTDKGIRYVSLILSEGTKVPITDLRIDGVYSMSQDDALKKLSSFSPRLVQRHFYQESGINKAADLFAEYLKSQGYLSAKLEFVKTDFTKDHKKVAVVLLFNEGVQTFLQSIKINGVKSLKTEEVVEMLGVKEGAPFNIFKFEQGLVALKQKYQELGNLNAQILNEGSESIVQYSKDNSAVSLQIDVDEGPLMHVGEVIVRGNQQTHARVIVREMPFIPGDILTRPLLVEAEENLRKLNLFGSVIVRSIDHPGDDSKKDILILVEETVPGSVEVTPGFRNDLGLRLGLGAAYQNIGGWDRSVSGEAIFNRRVTDYHFPEYDATIGFREPFLANWPVVFTSSLNLLRRQFTAFDATISKLTTTVKRDLTKNLSVFLEHSYEQDRIENAVYPYGPSDEGLSFIGAMTPGFIVDTRDNTYNPTKGVYSINRFELATKYFGSQQNIGYSRTSTSNSTYINVYDDWVLALAVSYGYERSNIADSPIPTFKLFRMGGIGSLRGYDDDEIEVDTSNTINGSLSLVDYRSELRIPLSGAFGTALFVDAGNLLVDHFSIIPSALLSSAGIGLRYKTPVGPVLLDVARRLQSNPEVAGTQLPPGNSYKIHFAIGSF